jgi:hypothetical protein
MLTAPGRARWSPRGAPVLGSGTIWLLGLWMMGVGLTFTAVGPVWENDVFFHVRLGQWILAGGDPAGDPGWLFGPTAGQGWVNTMAPAEAVLALLHRWGGWPAVALIQVLAPAALLAGTWWAVSSTTVRSASPVPARLAAVITLTAVVLVSPQLTIRPQTWSLVFMAVLSATLIRVAVTGRFPAAVPTAVAVWLWSCWHGYGLLVAPLMGLAAVAHVVAVTLTTPAGRVGAAAATMRRLVRGGWAPVGAAFAVTFFTPAGAGLWSSAAAIREVATAVSPEWQRPELSDYITLALLGLLGVWGFVAWRTWRAGSARGVRRAVIAEAVLLVGWVLLGASTYRMMLLVLVLATVVVASRAARFAAQQLAGSARRWETLPAGSRWTQLPVALALCGVVVLGIHVPQIQVSTSQVPVALYRQLAAQPGSRLVLIDPKISSSPPAFVPEGKVVTSVDGRLDLFGREVMVDYLTMLQTQPGWQQTLARYREATDAILQVRTPLTGELLASGWTPRGEYHGWVDQTGPVTWVWLTSPQVPFLEPVRTPIR